MTVTVSDLIAQYENQVTSLESSLQQLDDLDSSLTEQATAITGVCTAAEGRLRTYLTDTKAPSFSPTAHATVNSGVIGYGNTLSDWNIMDSVLQPPDPMDPMAPPVYADQIIYSLGVAWDNDPSVLEYMADWAEANDMLTRPTTSGATYGVLPYQANIATASNILNENKSKYESSITTFGKYT